MRLAIISLLFLSSACLAMEDKKSKRYLVVDQDECETIENEAGYDLATFDCYICTAFAIIANNHQFLSHTSSYQKFSERVENKLRSFMTKISGEDTELKIIFIGALLGHSDHTINLALEVILTNYRGTIKIFDFTSGGWEGGASSIILDQNRQNIAIFPLGFDVEKNPNHIYEYPEKSISNVDNFSRKEYDVFTTENDNGASLIDIVEKMNPRFSSYLGEKNQSRI